MEGDPTLFARQDAVEAAWAIVDPVLETPSPSHSVRLRQQRAGRSEDASSTPAGRAESSQRSYRPRSSSASWSKIQRECVAKMKTPCGRRSRRAGRFIVALPGGSVAPAFFPALAEIAIDWTRIEVFWIDERAVPPDHPDSNYGARRVAAARSGRRTRRAHSSDARGAARSRLKPRAAHPTI